MLDITQDSYNKFTQFPNTSYNIIKYLIYNEEEMWKLLKYADADAWNKPNLTIQEKVALVYSGQPNETDFRLFNNLGQDNSWTVEACILRIAPATLLPTNHVNGHQSIVFEVYSHYKIITLSDYTNRNDVVTQRLIECLNGADIENVGRLYFDYRASPYCKSVAIGSIPFKGRGTIMCNSILG